MKPTPQQDNAEPADAKNDSVPEPGGSSRDAELPIDGLDRLLVALALEKKKSEECINRLKYLQADFDNYAKRMDRQMEDVKRRTAESIYSNLLEVIDELELALQSGRSSKSTEVLMEGVDMTLKKMKKLLMNEGISEIVCEGQRFDPKFHSAISTASSEEAEEGIVLEELRKGYTIQGRVLRPAMVKVSVKESRSEKKPNDGRNV